MASGKGKLKKALAEAEVSKGGDVIELPDGRVRVWGSIRITVPLPGEGFTGAFTTEFGHERLAKSSSQREVQNAARLIEELNERELERVTRKYLRQFHRMTEEIAAGDEQSIIQITGGAQARAHKRISGKKGKGKKK